MNATTAADFYISDLADVFADLAPGIPQDDGPADAAVCKIAYPTAFTLAFDYFRAVLQRCEYSTRALRLTTLCLQQNPANYTVWHYRRLCLYALQENSENKDWKDALKAELLWTATLGGDNPKNYQIWYHRRALLENAQQQQQQGSSNWMRDIGTAELDYIGTVLLADGKNYHAWSHRQWVVNKIMTTVNDADTDNDDVWQAEMKYAARLLETDVRNNSAWNHRWFALHHGAAASSSSSSSSSSFLSLPAARNELEFSMSQARLDLDNESPFRYLVALLKEQCKTLKDDASQMTLLLDEYLDKVDRLVEQQEVAAGSGLDDNGPETTSRHVTGTLVDLLEFKGDSASWTRAMALIDDLATRQDPIRNKYWNLRRLQIQQKQTQAPQQH